MAVRRRVGWIVLLVVAALALTVGWQFAAAHREPERAQELLVKGSKLYGTYCEKCHRPHLEGGPIVGGWVAPPLVKPGFAVFFYTLPSGMEGFVADEIRLGNGPMPPFREVLTQAEIEALAFFVHRMNQGG